MQTYRNKPATAPLLSTEQARYNRGSSIPTVTNRGHHTTKQKNINNIQATNRVSAYRSVNKQVLQ